MGAARERGDRYAWWRDDAAKACYDDFLTLGRRIGEVSGFVVD
jgi:hypothetical protein